MKVGWAALGAFVLAAGVLRGAHSSFGDDLSVDPGWGDEGGAVNLDQKVYAMADAIAHAEGFYESARVTLPQRLNNPCDLKGMQDGEFKLLGYPTLADGWIAGRRQCRLMLTGRSHVYDLDWTWLQVADKYTGSDNALGWARTVSGRLGFAISNTLRQFAEA